MTLIVILMMTEALRKFTIQLSPYGTNHRNLSRFHRML
jgi:hypothetical protein